MLSTSFSQDKKWFEKFVVAYVRVDDVEKLNGVCDLNLDAYL